jgi:hypothetical protein
MQKLRIDKAKFFKKIGYDPHQGQWSYHNSTARFKAAVCGRRYGKSTVSARDMEPELFLPDRSFWIVGPTYDLGEKEFRIIWNDLIRDMKLGRDKRIKKGFNKNQGDMFIQFPWGTRVEVRSAKHPDTLVGEGLDGVIMAEAAKHKENTFDQYIRPALADKRGWAALTTTPEGMNWVHGFWQKGQDPSFEQYESWRMPSWENDAIYPGGRNDPEILLLERTLSRETFEQEIEALFTAFVGKIYKEWDEMSHVTEIEYDPNLPNYIFWDWGYVNELAALDVQITPRDEVRIWREHYMSFKTLDEHFDIMRNRPQPDGYRIDNGFGDAADPEAVAQVNQKFGPCVALPEAKENWREGIELVKSFLKTRDSTEIIDEYGTPAEGRPGLYVDHSCRATIREFGIYKGKESTDRANPNELGRVAGAQKKDDHAMDALRYGLMHLFKLGAQYHLNDVIAQPLEPSTPYEHDYGADRHSYELAGLSGEGGYFSMNDQF